MLSVIYDRWVGDGDGFGPSRYSNWAIVLHFCQKSNIMTFDDIAKLCTDFYRDHLCDLCVCMCLSVCPSVCPCSHGRNFERISTKFGTDVRNLKRKNPFVGGQNPIRVSPIFTVLPNFTPNWHPRNAFSMGDLKRFSDIIYGPIIGS